MILDEQTKNKFGYAPSQLSHSSHKRVNLLCDYCGGTYEATLKNVINSRKIIAKDCCVGCKFKKREEVSIKRDGVRNSAQRADVREKIKNSDWIKSDAHKEMSKMASQKNVEARIRRGEILCIDGKTMPQHAKEQGLSRTHFGKLIRRYGFEEAKKHVKYISSLEQVITHWLDEVGIEYETQFRVGKKIADIKVGNLLIETDGCKFHHDGVVDKKYHQEKMLLYKKHGYRTMFFRSDEIEHKLPIVKSIILNGLHRNQFKLFARKLTVKTVPHKIAMEFIKENHLMGSAGSVTCSYGLFNGEDLVSLLQMKKSKDGEYDISRYCNKLNTTVVGAFSRLLSHFIKGFQPKKISTFIDLRYGLGEYLPSMGFVLKSSSLSFRWTNKHVTFHRLMFRGNSGYKHRLHKIWDCGQARYEKTF